MACAHDVDDTPAVERSCAFEKQHEWSIIAVPQSFGILHVVKSHDADAMPGGIFHFFFCPQLGLVNVFERIGQSVGAVGYQTFDIVVVLDDSGGTAPFFVELEHGHKIETVCPVQCEQMECFLFCHILFIYTCCSPIHALNASS